MRVRFWALAIGMTFLLTACGGGQKTAAESVGSGESSAVTKEESSGQPTVIRIGSGPSGAIHYTTFSGIASLIEADHKNYTVSVEISTGSNENINNLYANNVDFGLVTADSAYDGYNAAGDFEGNEEGQILHVMSGYSPHIHVFVRSDSDIYRFEDLAGKRAGTGKGFMSGLLNMILDGYGIGGNVLASSEAMSLSDMCTALADGNIDVGCYISDFPSSNIADLALTTGIRFLEIDEDVANKICDGNDFYYVSEIDADYYEGVEENVRALATRTVLVARKDLDEEIVYNVVKSIVDHGDELGNFHSRAPLWNLDNALKLQVIPLHPGAERYYKEAGILQ